MAINDWMRGTGTDALRGATNSPLINDYTTAYLQDPLDLMLTNYRKGCWVTYASASTVTIGAGELMLTNSAGDAKRMRQNTASITIDITADLDTGSEAADTWYYVYAVERCWTISRRGRGGRVEQHRFRVRCREGTFELYQDVRHNTWHMQRQVA